MLTLADKVDLESRENLVLGSSKYTDVCYPCGPQGLWVLKAKPAAIKADVKNAFSTSKAKQRQINKVRKEGAEVYVLNGYGGRNRKAIDIASNLAGKGMEAIVPPVDGGRADNTKYTGTVIRVYNGADESKPETFTRLKRTLKDKKRSIEFVDDSATTADFVVIVGDKTEALKP
jgi:ABC-type branched-subunit amino acid transport system substrate-binding protein